MKKIYRYLLMFGCLMNVFPLLAQKNHSLSYPYDQINDIYHPTLEDYRKIQHYLTHGKRESLELLTKTKKAMRNMKIIGDGANEIPQSGNVAVNCSKDEKENCLLTYASFNQNYPNGLKRLVQFVSRSDF